MFFNLVAIPTIDNDLDYKRKRRSRLVWTIIIVVFLLAITTYAALAYSLDTYEDDLYVKQGDLIKGSFIIENYVPGTTLKSNMEWVSLDENKYISEKAAEGLYIVDNNYVFYYYVKIPNDADIGIYRGIIEVKSQNTSKILNLKINVQNGIVNSTSKVLTNPNSRWPMIAIIIFILMIILLITYLRVKKR